MLLPLNDAELALTEGIKDGKEADLSGVTSPVRVNVLRHFLLQIPDPVVPEWIYAGGKLHWAIRGARFDERLDLRDARSRDGGPLPALDFNNCTFSNGFSADGASLVSLRFADCNFCYDGCDEVEHPAPSTPISLRNSRIAGELRFKNLKPCGERALLWIYSKGIDVTASIRFHNVHLRAPKGELVLKDGSTRYGLDLEGARIAGHLRLHPDVNVEGGVRLQSAHIDGNCWADGLHATDGEDAKSRAQVLGQSLELRDAVDAQTATIGGIIVLRTYVTPEKKKKQCLIEGNIRFFGTHVSGGIYLDGLRVPLVPVEVAAAVTEYEKRKEQNPSAKPPDPEMRECHVQMAHAVVGGALSVEPIWLPVEILRPSISGALFLVDAKLESFVSIDADLNLLNLNGSTIASNFTLRGSMTTIAASQLTVGGDATLAPRISEPYTVDLRRSRFHGSLDITLLRFEHNPGRFFKTPPVLLRQLNLRGSTVDRTFAVVPYPPVFLSARKVDLKCWPGYSVVEVQVAKSPDSDADRDSWRGSESAFVTFLCQEAMHIGHIIDGTTLVSGNLIASSQLQHMVATALHSMDFTSDEAVNDYLRLFCACLSAEETDFFSIAEELADLPLSLRKVNLTKLSVPVRSIVDEATVSDTVGFMRGRGHISKFTFRLHGNGIVSLEGEEPLLIEEVREERHYDRPYRYGADAGRPDYSPLRQGHSLTRSSLEALLPGWQNALVTHGRFSRTRIDLRDATCTTLQDEGGSAWQGAKLLLENFTYTRLVSSRAALREVELRKHLLEQRPSDDYFDLEAYHYSYREALPHLKTLQVVQNDPSILGMIQHAAEEMNGWFVGASKVTSSTDPSLVKIKELLQRLKWDSDLLWLTKRAESVSPIQEPFHPQPYAQLARVLRDQGDEEGSREIEKEKIRSQLSSNISRAKDSLKIALHRRTGGRIRWTGRIVQRWVALAGRNAWIWLYGYGFGYGLDLLRASFTLVICWAVGWATVAAANHTGYLIASTSTVTSMIATTEAGITPVFPKNAQQPYLEELPCGGNINQFLYAVETFTPLLNLRQESRCDLRSPHVNERFSLTPRLLELLKFSYELLGYVVTSLAFLTFSGIARRWDQS